MWRTTDKSDRTQQQRQTALRPAALDAKMGETMAKLTIQCNKLRTHEEMLRAIYTLFTSLEPETEEEVDAILVAAGYDPVELAEKGRAIADQVFDDINRQASESVMKMTKRLLDKAEYQAREAARETSDE